MTRREPQCAVLRDSSPDRVRSADLLSALLVPRLLLSPLIAHNALIRTMAASRFTLCCWAWVRLRHALLAAMLAALILHTFQIVSLGIAIRPCFHGVCPANDLELFRAFLMPDNAIRGRRVPSGMRVRAKSTHSPGT